MGLNQYVYKRQPDDTSGDISPEFVWRKHAKLQEFMERVYFSREGEDAPTFNCIDLPLTRDDIEALELLVQTNDLPTSEGGFFFGHQWQDESATEYKEQDLTFCKWAKAILETREQVNYSCCW